MRIPIRTRLTLLFAGLSAVVLGVAAAALLWGFRAELARTVDEALTGRFASIADDPVSGVEQMAGSDETFAQYVHADGTLVTSLEVGEPMLPAALAHGLDRPRFFDGRVDEGGEVVPVRILAGPAGDGELILAMDVEDQREAIARLTAIVGFGGPILLLAMGGLGWILAGSALRPVERLREEAAAISTIEPSRRLAVPDTGDELQRLAETLNVMIDRLQEALDRERRFLDEASHELRTPLALLKAELEVALRRPRTPEELEQAMQSAAQETDRLSRLAEDLLVLARSDGGQLPLRREPVRVPELLTRVLKRYGADGRPIVIDAHEGLIVDADGARLEQALANVVDNALRHGSGAVHLTAAQRDGFVELHVTDEGKGFPADFLPRAFERFTRADPARTGAGAGLGLAIASTIAKAHGGGAYAVNREGGGADVWISIASR